MKMQTNGGEISFSHTMSASYLRIFYAKIMQMVQFEKFKHNYIYFNYKDW